jgi:thymidylate synthase
MVSQPTLINAPSLGACWLQTCQLIFEQGISSCYDGLNTKEIANLTLRVSAPDPHDPLIRQYGDAAWLDWMHENFFTQKDVPELGDAPSYAVRLFNYAGQGRNQIDWVVRRLRNDRTSRSAAITTFQPLSDVSYIPCISLLDFWIPQNALDLVVYAHSLDFGKKAYGNLVELASLQSLVASQLACPTGSLTVYVKSAHIYATEWAAMRDLVETAS